MFSTSKFQPLRFCLTVLAALVMFFPMLSTAYADPTESEGIAPDEITPGEFIEDPTGAYLTLNVDVPEGFRGSVSVTLENEETHEEYTVTAYRVNFYSNSISVPFGKYSISRVFTSEDKFLYPVHLDEYELDIQSNHTLHASVTYNEEGAAYEDGSTGVDKEQTPANVPTGETTDTNTSTSQPQESGNVNAGKDTDTEQTPSPDENKPADDTTQQEQNTPADDQPESKGSVVTYILKVVIGTAVFVGIVFGTVYFVRKQQGF